MSQISPKNKNKNYVKAIVLSELLISCLDDIQIEKNNPLTQNLQKVMYHLENIVDRGYEHETVRGSSDMQELVNKVDTLIRKNLQ